MVCTKKTPHHAEVCPLKCIVYITQNPVTFVIQQHRELFLLDQQQNQKEHYKRYVHIQIPIHNRTLLIADVTRLQPFTMVGEAFRENIETLVSYNVQNNGKQQDFLYIEQGHLVTPTLFMNCSMAIDPCRCVVVSWTPVFYVAAGLPAILSTCITVFYILLKVGGFLFHAISHKAKGRVEAPMPGSGRQVDKSTVQIRERKVTRKFANKYKDILQKTDTMADGQNNPQGPYLYREGGKIYTSLPTEMIQGIQQSELYEKMKKDCKVEGIEIPQNIMAQDPLTHVLTP